jgi:hypothetical protein
MVPIVPNAICQSALVAREWRETLTRSSYRDYADDNSLDDRLLAQLKGRASGIGTLRCLD